MSVLVVAALAEEVAHVDGVELLVTGVGKALAGAALARRFAAGPTPRLVVNVGTAGAVTAGVDGLLEVEFVTQHDFPYTAIEALVGNRVTRGFRLAADLAPQPVHEIPPDAATVASGDTFVADVERARAIAARGARLVDMESYAYAATCAAFEVPMRCVKAVSDGADSDAAESWVDSIDRCARDLAAWVECHILGG